MDNETLFYICGGIAAVSAVLVTFVGLKSKNFPGRVLPLVIVWFAAFAVAAGTFSVLQAKDHEAHELEAAGHRIEEAEGQPHENEEAEGPQEEEPVGPVEGSEEAREQAEEGAGPSATTLKLAADPTALLFDKSELTAKAGKVTIDFNNPSAIPHNVVIEKDGEEIAGTPEITESEDSVSTDLEPGTYTFLCTVPGHAQAGMEGTLVVE